MPEQNPNSRLEAFCDGVFAIALTLLIIDIKIPSSVTIETTNEFWRALLRLVPSIFAFALSFIVILITWVNHHGFLKLIQRSTASFMFANGFLLFTVVVIPFPTALLGEYLFTDHSAPAVILYNATMVLQAIGWILVNRTALKNQLAKNEPALAVIRKNGRYGYFAFILYFLYAVIAWWFPLTIAILTTAIWTFWLVLAIRLKHE